MNKIKEFFKSKITKAVAWVLLCVCVVVLVIGGTSTEAMTNGMVLAAGVVSAVCALVAFINSCIKKD